MANRLKNVCMSSRLLVPCFLMLSLVGCSGGLPSISDMNPFKKEETKLPGTRIAVLGAQGGAEGEQNTSGEPVQLPGEQANQSWEQPGGNETNSPGHLSFSGAMKTIWTASSGEGSSSDGHLTSSPLVYQGKIYTIDAEGKIRAFSASGGSQVWTAATKPENEDASEGYGGGLAISNGRLFAATGFGTVKAFDVSSGKQLWEKSIGIPIRSSPTASQDRIFVVTTEGKLYCLSGIDGAELWNFRGLPESASLLSNTSPAVAGDIVIVPFASGEVGAFNVSDGKQLWIESLTSRKRSTAFSAFNTAASPSIDSNLVFAASNAGRMIAASTSSGERLWTQNIASNQKPYVAGNSVFVVDVNGKILALSKKDGAVRWTTDLPPNQGTWSGPVLAGNRVWAVSSKGLVVGLNAASGQIATKRDLDTKVYIPPIVAQSKMFIYTDKARLLALN